MIKGCKYGFWLLFCMALCFVYCFPAFATGRLLDAVYLADSNKTDYLQVDTITDATGSDAATPEQIEEDYEVEDASASDADEESDDDIMLLSDYDPYDSGTISSTVVNYMSDVVPKLGPVHYVLFRAGQYDYRLYYARDLELSDSGEFWASEADYIQYDSRYYTWSYGSESDFSLDPGSTLVYSDLGGYPMLGTADTASWVLVFLAAVFLLFTLYRSFFASHTFRI